jgi:hypothetical protein
MRPAVIRPVLCLVLLGSACKGKHDEASKQPSSATPGSADSASGSAAPAPAGSVDGSAAAGSAAAGSAAAGPAATGSAAAGSAAARGSKTVDLQVEGNKDGESSLRGTLEVPSDAVLEFFRSRGPEDVPVDSVFVKTAGISVTLDEQSDDPKTRITSLAALIKHEKVKDADILHKAEPAGGFAIAYKTGQVVAVQGGYADITCGVSFDAPEAEPAKIETAFKICSSYKPAPK